MNQRVWVPWVMLGVAVLGWSVNMAHASSAVTGDDGSGTGDPHYPEWIANGVVPPVKVEGEDVTPRLLEQAMEEADVPALALAVVDGCEVVWSGAWGVTGDGGVPVTGETPFQVGSVSKLVSAITALAMVEDEAFSLDDDIRPLLTSWHLPDNDFALRQTVTVRHLLTHSAGLTRTGYWFDRGEGMPPLSEILSGESGNPAVVVEELPGSRAVPSNSGFLVLQVLMEDVAGKPLGVLASERVFSRSGMGSSAFEPVSEAFLARGATNHGRDGAGLDGKAPLIPGAPGGLWSSVDDLGRLLAALMGSWQGRDGSLLSRDTVREMLVRHVGDMGLGLHLHGQGESFSVQQRGGGVGSLAHVIGFPNRCQGAVVVVNSDRGRRVVAETLAAVGEAMDWPGLPLRGEVVELSAEDIRLLVGKYVYDAAPQSSATFIFRDDGLAVRFGERDAVPLMAFSDRLFVLPGAGLAFEFEEAQDGSSPGLTVGTAGLYGSHLTRSHSGIGSP